jgi:hypothetical protein
MLRGRMGDEPFFDFLRTYATDPLLVHRNVTTVDMVTHASAAAGEDMGAFLDPWLTTDLVPVLDVAVASYPVGELVRVELTITQRQQPCFPLIVPVRLITDQGVFDERAPLDGCHSQFQWTVPGSEAQVILDPDRWLLMRSSVSTAPLLQAAAAYPNPALGTEVRLPFYLRTAAKVSAAVYDVRGRLLRSWDLGTQSATGVPEDATEPHLWLWDGKLTDGQRAPAGVYWMEIRAAERRAVRKVTLMR